jgi:hypothetical protein
MPKPLPKPMPKPQARSGAVPFYERDAAARALRATMVRASDLIGLHAICPRQTCRRARACRDRDPRDRPFCTYHYMGILRFVLQLAAATDGGTKPERDAEAPEDLDAMPAPWRGPSLFDKLKLSRDEIAGLRRPSEAGRDPWAHERDPDALAVLAALRAARAPKPGRPRAGAMRIPAPERAPSSAAPAEGACPPDGRSSSPDIPPAARSRNRGGRARRG